MSKQTSSRGRIEEVAFLDAQRSPRQEVPARESFSLGFIVALFEDILFDPTVRLSIVREDNGAVAYARSMREDGWDIAWLPRGKYRVEWHTPALALPSGAYRIQIELAVIPGGRYRSLSSTTAPGILRVVEGKDPGAGVACIWRLESCEGTTSIEHFSWKKGPQNWFYKHFDHAARVIIYYMFEDSPLLQGKILDIGGGDGITDLGVFLRKRPELFVSLDLEANSTELSRMMRENGLPFDSIPDNLVFNQTNVNRIPYPDNTFDVVLSWASLEHVYGGYGQVLREVKRVLKDGGLFFVHPGLYYSNFGHHLGEFSKEPFFHLTKTPDELKELVFTAPPNYIDRGGVEYTPADFWRYYSELNKITVSKIEGELRALDFQFHKVAVRTEDVITYTPELQHYSLQDLTTQELYISVVNRKPAVESQPCTRAVPPKRSSDGPYDYSRHEFAKDRTWNREILAEQVGFFSGCRKVLDLACGSGIFLELLAERGIPALGVERNQEVVEWVRAQGWEVIQQDVLRFLEQSQETYDGILCSHFLEHLSFADVLRLFELLVSRLESQGTVVFILPNPESIRMHLFGFWRDPEHVRFYHPELIEAVCQHYGLQVVHTNRQEEPFAIPPLSFEASKGTVARSQPLARGWWKETVRGVYFRLLRTLRLTPYADVVGLEERLRQERVAMHDSLSTWSDKATWAINRMWAWPDNAAIVCRKLE